MLKLLSAIVLMALCAAGGLLAAFAAWDTMYPEKGHPITKFAVNAFTVFVFLGFLFIGLGGVMGIYE